MAALAIAAAVFVVISEFAGRALRNWNKGDVTIAAMEMFSRGLGRMETDLSLAVPMGVPGTDGTTVLFTGDATGLVFAAATGYGTGDKGLELISITTVADADQLTLIRRRSPVANPAPEPRDPVVLMRGRMQIRFSYRDRDGQVVYNWNGRPDFPSFVAVEILGPTGNSIFPVPAMIRLPSNDSADCINPDDTTAGLTARCPGQKKDNSANADNSNNQNKTNSGGGTAQGNSR